MSNISQDYIEEYIRKTIKPSDGLLKDMENYARLKRIPIIQPEVARFLEVMIKSCKCKRVLEVGTAIGYSAVVIVRAAGEEGQVVTIEQDRDMENKAKEFIQKSGLSEQIKVIRGDAREVLKKLDSTFDMVFIDGAKGHYREMLDLSLRLVKSGGIILCDNVLFRGMVASDNLVRRRKITIVKRMRDFLKYICAHPQLDTAIIPIGDGLSVSYRKEF